MPNSNCGVVIRTIFWCDYPTAFRGPSEIPVLDLRGTLVTLVRSTRSFPLLRSRGASIGITEATSSLESNIHTSNCSTFSAVIGFVGSLSRFIWINLQIVIFEIAIPGLVSRFRAPSHGHICSLALCIWRRVFEPLLHAFVAILNVLVGLIGRRVYLCDLCTAKTPTRTLDNR